MGRNKQEWLRQLYQSLTLAHGEKITVELSGVSAEMTAQGCVIKNAEIKKTDVLQSALLIGKIARDIRDELIRPTTNTEKVAKDIKDLIECAQEISDYAQKTQ